MAVVTLYMSDRDSEKTFTDKKAADNYDKIAVSGGDGTIVLFHVDGNFCQSLLKTQIFGSVNGLSTSHDGI